MANIYAAHWEHYFDLGFIPYPGEQGIKGTLIKWQKDFPPEIVAKEICEQWAKKYPGHGVWVIIGDQHAVIDPDGPGAEEFVKSLNLPKCPVSESGKKSIHRWVKVSSPVKYVKALTGDDETFLELRTGKMGMMAPPSIHPETKRPYRWAEGLSPWDIPFPELPGEAYQKILALTIRSEPKMEATGDGLSGSLDVAKYLSHHGINFKVKPDGSRTIYALGKCLFADAHTTPSAKGDSSIIQGADGKLGYQCFHNHCSLRTWQDARQAISGNASIAEFCHGCKPSKEEKQPERALVSLKQAILDADQIRVMDFPEKRKILAPWLSEQSLVLVYGWRGVGKTWFALGLCDAVTRGDDFGPWSTITPVPCLYVDGEMAIQDVKERLEFIRTDDPRKQPLLIYSDFYGNSLGQPKVNLMNHRWRNAIKEVSEDWSIKLIVLDNISSLCPGIDENSKFDWDPINQWLLDLRFNGISVMALHHVGKEGAQRGTSAREDNIDISIHLIQPADYVPEDGARFIVKFSKARIRTADLALIADTEFHLKEKDGRAEWTFSGTKKKNKVEVLRLLSKGVPQKEIGEMLKLTKGRVSQIRLNLIEENYISEKDKLTIKGEVFLNEK